MKPLRLEMQGLYSYREPAVIDFETLTRGGLFGIFGPVGSGKSAILEAVTFVLYGRTERMNQQDQRSYNMMNLQSDTLFIDFQFQVRGQVYRFTVSARRNRNNFQDIRNMDRGAYRREGEDWIPLEGSGGDRAEEVLGLSYENFRRTIIIPQGKFQEFLQLGSTDRTAMLEQLFGLERFNLQNRTSALMRENQDELNRLAGRFEHLAPLSAETLLEEEEKLRGLEKRREELREKTEQLRKSRDEWVRRLELTQELSRAETVLSEAEAGLKEAAGREELLNRIESARREFSAPLSRLEELDRELHLLGKEQEATRTALAEVNLRGTELDSRLAEVMVRWESRDELRILGENLTKLAAWKTREAEEAGLEAEGKEKRIKLEALRLREEELAGERKKLQESLSGRKQNLLPTRTRMDIQRWLDRRDRRIGQAEELSRELAEQRTRISETGAEIENLGKEGILAGEFPDGLNREILEKLKAGLSLEVSADSETIRNLAAALTPGQPCPVCGSSEHPAPADQVSHDGEEAVRSLSGRREELLRLETALLSLEARREMLIQNARTLEGRLEALGNGEPLLSGELTPEVPLPEEPEELRLYLENQEQLEAETAALENRFREEEGELERIRPERESLAVSAAETDKALTAVRAVREQLLSGVPPELIDERKESAAAELADEAEEIVRQLRDLETGKDTLTREREEIRIRLGNLSAAGEFQKQALEEKGRKRTAQASELDDLLSRSAFPDLEGVKQALASDLPVEQERQRLEELKKNAAVALRRVEELKEKTGKDTYHPEEHRRAEKDLEEAQKAGEELSSSAGGLDSAIETLKKQLSEKQELELLIAGAETRRDNLAVMSRLFKARGFVNYVSTLYLRELVDRANERFEILCRRSLRLELTEDNSFAVRDFLNDGRLRSVKTLSGGQTFQASFSLALALADSVNEKTGGGPGTFRGEGFFFLDEGFGSLDRESLAIVMEALRTLGRENRIVGVISHVEEMQQDIQSYLQITREEDQGSRILPSWIA